MLENLGSMRLTANVHGSVKVGAVRRNTHEAAQRSLRAVTTRATESKAYIERGEIDISKEEIEREFEKQMRVRVNEMTRQIADRLKDKNLPSDVRQFMEESIAPGQDKKKK